MGTLLIEETDKRFCLKDSTLPNAGTGVFAIEPIKAGDYLEIIGVRVKVGSTTDHCTRYGQPYKFFADEKKQDQVIVPMGYGGMVNHANTKYQQNVEIRYLHHPPRNAAAGKLIYYFLRDVDEGEEILGDYGENWNSVIDWASSAAEAADEARSEWGVFLSHDLYILGQLKDTIPF